MTDANALAQAELAKTLATIAHTGQTDKLGVAYIQHPASVAAAFDRETEWVQHCAAWLHDVVEDTMLTERDLIDAGVAPAVVDVVRLLTRTDDVPADEYYERIRHNPAARLVKLADIAHNLAPSRIAQLDDETRERLTSKYEHAIEALEISTATDTALQLANAPGPDATAVPAQPAEPDSEETAEQEPAAEEPAEAPSMFVSVPASIVEVRDSEPRIGKKVLYIDLDNTLVDFGSRADALDAELAAEYAGRLDEIPGIFALMRPMPGAIAAFKKLAQEFDTYILSTAPWKNPSAWQHKVEWVHLHLGISEGTPAYKRLILSHHKNLNRGEFLVDDRPDNGASEFEGEWVHFGAEGFTTWDDVTAYLLARA